MPVLHRNGNRRSLFGGLIESIELDSQFATLNVERSSSLDGGLATPSRYISGNQKHFNVVITADLLQI
jgi:hypothetical protein